jgi:TM2 domain-containing membrane protein YozV
MTSLVELLPEIEGEERARLLSMTQGFSERDLVAVAAVYRARRKEPQTVLLLALLGLVGVAGIHRLVLRQIAMGLLYLVTGGFCAIGTILDLFNFRHLALEYNDVQMREAVDAVRPA